MSFAKDVMQWSSGKISIIETRVRNPLLAVDKYFNSSEENFHLIEIDIVGNLVSKTRGALATTWLIKDFFGMVKKAPIVALRQVKFCLPRQAVAPQYTRCRCTRDTLLSLMYCGSCIVAKAAI